MATIHTRRYGRLQSILVDMAGYIPYWVVWPATVHTSLYGWLQSILGGKVGYNPY